MLSGFSPKYDNLINKFYDVNIFSIASNICDLTERNDVVDLYSSISKHIDEHFHIFKTAEMEKVLLQVNSDTDVNLDKFLNNMVNQYKDCIYIYL